MARAKDGVPPAETLSLTARPPTQAQVDVGSAALLETSDPTPTINLEARHLTPHDRRYLQDILRCSVCGSAYDVSDDAMTCTKCGARSAIVNGVAILLKDSTVGTTLDLGDYDASYGVTEQAINRIGAEWSAIIERFGLPRGDALEIGSGTGQLTLGLLREKAVEHLTATDVSEKFLRILGARGR